MWGTLVCLRNPMPDANKRLYYQSTREMSRTIPRGLGDIIPPGQGVQSKDTKINIQRGIQ